MSIRNKRAAVPPPTAALVIRGPSTKYIPGMRKDDYAIVQAHTLYIVGDKVHGVFYNSYGKCTQFSMPLCSFSELEYVELSTEPMARSLDEPEDPLGFHFY